jgi:hypothetical protein
MNRSASPLLPIGRQRETSGGHLVREAAVRHGPTQVALVVEHGVGAAETLGGLPVLPGRVVVVWRCNEEDARRGEQEGRFDCVIYSDADEVGGPPTLRYRACPEKDRK